jgi:uncharacterized repeat protein (TIGR01451 family)
LIFGDEANLRITKIDALDPVTVGDSITYTITVDNNGPDSAENVVLTDNLPSSVFYVSATPSQGICSQVGGVVTCNLGDVPNGASINVEIVVTTTTAGLLTNNTSVTADTADPGPGNNSDSETTTVNPLLVPQADLGVIKTDTLDPVTVGDSITYTVTVNNSGPDSAQNVVLTDDLPGSVVYISATPDQGTCSQVGGVVTCNLGDMPNGGSTSVEILCATTSDNTLTNNVSVGSDTADLKPGNDSDSEKTTVELLLGLQADLGVTKVDDLDLVTVGENITYTITVNNSGPDSAKNVVLTDTLPDTVVYVSNTPGQGSCFQVGRVVTCNLGDIPNGDSTSVEIVVMTTIADTISNSASVTADTADTNPDNNNASETTTVIPGESKSSSDILLPLVLKFGG